jgi:aminoglycoside phosphotransferase (APT) family kinase protein
LLAQNSDRLMAVGSALSQASQRAPERSRMLPNGHGVTVRPLAYWPEAQMVLQPAIVDGVELHKYAFDLQVDEAVRKRCMYMAGAGLAALHNITGLDGPRRVLLDDLHDLREYYPVLAKVDPALATRFAGLIVEIGRLAQRRNQKAPEVAPVASHGALRTDQIMLQQGRPVFIDLDGFCWANPARDVGNLLAYLHWKALRQPQYAAFIEQAGQVFCAAYQEMRARPDPYWLALYQATSMLKIVGRRFQSLTYREWPLASQLLEAVCDLMPASS